jgi:inositol oxygenase
LNTTEKQTFEFNINARANFRKQKRGRMSVWAAMEKLNTLVDDSDVDTSITQIEHLLQTAEAIRRDGKPEWMQVVGVVHDLGKLLYTLGSEFVCPCFTLAGFDAACIRGQWDVVGDTFVVGCKFPDCIVFHETFAGNPDSQDPVYSTENGVYKPGCGLDNGE